jgi:hypothetical protein
LAFSSNLYRVLIRFNFVIGGTAAEVQETGFWTRGGGIGSDRNATCQELAARTVNAWATNIVKTHYSAAVVADRVSVYYYGGVPTGDAQAAGEAGFTGANAWAGAGEGTMPPENSIVVSTLAFAPGEFVPLRGRRRRGRMYPPTPNSSIMDATGRLSSGNQGAYLDSYLAFFADMTGSGNDGAGGPPTDSQPVVVSLADVADRPITHLRVGRVVDTQRRRRNKLAELYVDGAIS